jgi:hypothetical protein
MHLSAQFPKHLYGFLSILRLTQNGTINIDNRIGCDNPSVRKLIRNVQSLGFSQAENMVFGGFLPLERFVNAAWNNIEIKTHFFQ